MDICYRRLTSAGIFEDDLVEDEGGGRGDQVGQRGDGRVTTAAGASSPDDHRGETTAVDSR